MLKIRYHGQFKKDYKLAVRRGCNMAELQEVITILVSEQELPAKYRDHALTDSKDFKNMHECHIEPDLLLIYQIIKKELILNLVRTGTHSDLF